MTKVSRPAKGEDDAHQNPAENLHLYQRITKILETMTNKIEIEMEERLQSLNRAFLAASDSVENLGPQVQRLRSELELASDVLREQLGQAAQESGDTVRSGLEDARSLHQLITMLVRTTKESAVDIASSHETALEVATQRANSEVDVFVTALTAAMASSVSLQDQMRQNCGRQRFLRSKRRSKQ
ncbi:hypothetical protein NW755_003747 [Fusarium falciforme]|uniref:Uncharacterized protein n=1 Tax=Fusarium falciforme TaxID=195108 RepID=A0A9W8RDC6_9HYPO|nr:hypothetical protein NW755_003747 [Fusarium falciforme]